MSIFQDMVAKLSGVDSAEEITETYEERLFRERVRRAHTPQILPVEEYRDPYHFSVRGEDGRDGKK